ncbi:MAG: hypothetical protein M1839_002319 [Geoglossum umbratile]|nr:MAG: hypothetical protein M1839_002319 [Geoglossum umbratile]
MAVDPKGALVEDRDARVEDYLNDKLQTHDDLGGLESLLSNVRNQRGLLTKQLQEAKISLEKAHKASKSHASSVLQQAEAFQAQQADIDRRLLIVTRSETSDEAARRFERSMEKLRSLDIAKGYVEILREAEVLSAQARLNIKTSPYAALKSCARLQNLSRSLQSLQPAAEGAAPHLVDHVEKVSVALHRQMKEVLENEFEALLDRISWPSKEAKIGGADQNEWKEGVGKLLELQKVDLDASNDGKGTNEDRKEPLVLLPLEVMVKPLELRFRYHFDGNKPTNRTDKPEYFLSHIISLLNTYSDFLSQYLGPILRTQFAASNIGLNPFYADPTSAFITSLLPILMRKISHLLPEIASQPQLLSHFIHELISFDTTLREEWDYGEGDLEKWKGLTWEVLVKQEWFPRWLQVEKECKSDLFQHLIPFDLTKNCADYVSPRTVALSRYQTIISTKDAWEIDYDSVDPSMTKSTKSAIRLKDLLEAITDRYRPLTSLPQKLRFLIDIQIAILDQFHHCLHSAIEAYMVLTSSIARAVQGVSKEDQASLAGVGGLERLCRVLGSAEYLEKAMRDWSDDIFFLELWEELQERAANPGETPAGPVNVQEVANRASGAVGLGDDTDGLFDESASAFKGLRVRTEGLIVELLSSNMKEALRPYSRVSTWSSLNPEAFTATTTITPELDTPIRQLSSYLSFLSSALAATPLRRIFRQLAAFLQQYLWDYVLMRNTFSTSGAMQLSRDVTTVWDLMDRWLGEGQGEAGMRKFYEGVSLLSLPVEAVGEEGKGPDGVQLVGLRDVEKGLFESNVKAKEVLEELRLGVLTESEARAVLERRVELGS